MNAWCQRMLSAVATVIVLLGMAGCAGSEPAAPVPASPATATAAFGGTDLAWIEVTIAMDEQLLPLLDLVPQHGSDKAVSALAAGLRTFTNTELSALRSLHDQAGLSAQNPHEGMPMPGMVTADEVAHAATLSGTAFDKFVRQKITEGLRQGKSLAESERKYGVEARTRALATDGGSTRTRMLSALPG